MLCFVCAVCSFALCLTLDFDLDLVLVLLVLWSGSDGSAFPRGVVFLPSDSFPMSKSMLLERIRGEPALTLGRWSAAINRLRSRSSGLKRGPMYFFLLFRAVGLLRFGDMEEFVPAPNSGLELVVLRILIAFGGSANEEGGRRPPTSLDERTCGELVADRTRCPDAVRRIDRTYSVRLVDVVV